ncbi:hypothetical protein AACA86_11715 [Enterococcus faecalis]|uniref:hypothetical protein n=1 Tax=Bacillota TaxID=1239 RepID=UPI0024ACAAC2|nr:hypothetical protein [Peptoniphilus sp. Marseille-Q7072]
MEPCKEDVGINKGEKEFLKFKQEIKKLDRSNEKVFKDMDIKLVIAKVLNEESFKIIQDIWIELENKNLIHEICKDIEIRINEINQ